MPRKFKCSHCGGDLVVLKLDVGKYARCPECNEWNEVPETLEETNDMLNCKIDKKHHVDEQVLREQKFLDYMRQKREKEEKEAGEEKEGTPDSESGQSINDTNETTGEKGKQDSDKDTEPGEKKEDPIKLFEQFAETHSPQDNIHISLDQEKPEKIMTFRVFLNQLSPRVYATPGLIILNVLVFFVMILNGISPLNPDLSSIIPWGVKYSIVILENGEWWRFVTGMFIHAGLLHLVINMAGLWFLGNITERLYGSVTFTLIYLVSGLSGNVISLFLNTIGISAGSSGAIMGILGALIPVMLNRKILLPRRLVRQVLILLVVATGITFVFGFFVDFVDNAVHFGGFAIGVGIGYILQYISRKGTGTDTREEKRNKYMSIGGIGLVIFILGIIGGTFLIKPLVPLLEIMEYMQKQEYGNALEVVRENPEILKEIPEGNKLEAIIFGNAGWEKYLAGDFAGCIELSEKAYELDPVMALYARYNIALCYLRLGRIEKSKELYRELESAEYKITAENRKGVIEDLEDLIDKGIYVDEARFILHDIMKVNTYENMDKQQ
jgi:membrane associated rhomboid family serine protease